MGYYARFDTRYDPWGYGPPVDTRSGRWTATLPEGARIGPFDLDVPAQRVAFIDIMRRIMGPILPLDDTAAVPVQEWPILIPPHAQINDHIYAATNCSVVRQLARAQGITLRIERPQTRYYRGEVAELLADGRLVQRRWNQWTDGEGEHGG